MILNLTQHCASEDQLAQGVHDVPAAMRPRLAALMTFDSLPTASEILSRVEELTRLAIDAAHALGIVADDVMIGGAPYLMAPLERALERAMLTPVYAFSRRVSVETVLHDGSVSKTAIFRHEGWIDVVADCEGLS